MSWFHFWFIISALIVVGAIMAAYDFRPRKDDEDNDG